MLWNQKETDTGSLLFAGMARSYSYSNSIQVVFSSV
jgi:hypothetical protein